MNFSKVFVQTLSNFLSLNAACAFQKALRFEIVRCGLCRVAAPLWFCQWVLIISSDDLRKLVGSLKFCNVSCHGPRATGDASEHF